MNLLMCWSVLCAVQSLITNGEMGNVLLYGPPGTGKTTAALACATRLYGPNVTKMVLELNASDERGIGVVRTKVHDFVKTCSMGVGGFKLVILDEADALTTDAQMALRRSGLWNVIFYFRTFLSPGTCLCE